MTTDRLDADAAKELVALARSAEETIARLRGERERIVYHLRGLAARNGGGLTAAGHALALAATEIERGDHERSGA